jgi:hypothetical protein
VEGGNQAAGQRIEAFQDETAVDEPVGGPREVDPDEEAGGIHPFANADHVRPPIVGDVPGRPEVIIELEYPVVQEILDPGPLLHPTYEFPHGVMIKVESWHRSPGIGTMALDLDSDLIVPGREAWAIDPE